MAVAVLEWRSRRPGQQGAGGSAVPSAAPGEHRAGGVEPMDAFAKPRRPVGGAGRGGALAAFAAPPANRITVGKGRWASVRQELVDVGIGTGEKLCGNQKFTARSC